MAAAIVASASDCFISTSSAVGSDSTGPIATGSAPQCSAHPEAAEIIRQVEYYFGDENLPHDAHLLGLIKEEPNGSVSISEIMSWRKMRRFKPFAQVREALRQSELLEIVQNKRIKRKFPLTKQITVIPKISENRRRKVAPANQPWLTKEMLKPTGFEEYVTEGPLAPAEYERNRIAYDHQESITSRLEIAINRFRTKRKMHQDTLSIFEKFLVFGGIDCGANQFQGGVTKQELSELDKEEVERLTAHYAVSEKVIDGMDPELDGGPTWIVDFEALAKAFLSSQFTNYFYWYDEKQIVTATNILRNLYNYLLLHNVCPEYEDQIKAARRVCDLAEEELLRLREVAFNLPGSFNVACSTLHQGSWVGIHRSTNPEDDWDDKHGDNIGLSDNEAQLILKAGIAAYGDQDQYEKANAALNHGNGLSSFAKGNMGLEVVSVQLPDDSVKAFYGDEKFERTIVHGMGKMQCIRWKVPFAAPEDLPRSVVESRKDENFEFLVEEATLKHCYPGLKIVAAVKELDSGFKWLDVVEATYPSFFVWLPNERIREWKEPGPSRKARMVKFAGREQDDEQDDEDDDEDDDEESGGRRGMRCERRVSRLRDHQ